MHPAAPRRTARLAPPSSHALALLAVAVVLALVAPGRADGRPEDAAADGIARAERCGAGPALDAGWQRCIDAQLAALRGDPLGATGVRFHAWRVAERAAREGRPDATALGLTYRASLVDALRANRWTLHRLCASAGDGCASLADPSSPDA